MVINVFMPEFEIHTTPLESISINANLIEIFLDDISENRYKISTIPYQAIKIVAIDCVSSAEYYNEFCFRDNRYHRHILQIDNSDFMNELRKNGDLEFINNSKHFALPLQDIMIELAAYNLKVERIE